MEQNCIFCQIATGKVPAKKVYEDEQCIAVLDINPGAPGHLLLLPKKHAAVLPQLSDDDISHLMMISKSLSNTLLRALKVQGTTIFAANGPAAGQRAPHFMIHIIPRKENDGMALVLPESRISPDDLVKSHDAMLAKVRDAFKLDDAAMKRLEDRPVLKQDREMPKPSIPDAAQQPPEPRKSGEADLDIISGLFKGGKDV